jgi:hypothetical protein
MLYLRTVDVWYESSTHTVFRYFMFYYYCITVLRVFYSEVFEL